MGLSRLQAVLWFFSSVHAVEKLHPLQCGVLRLKYRNDRRPGLPIEPAWRFYPRIVAEFVQKHIKYYRIWRRIDRLRRSIRKDPNRASYRDQALAPVEAADTETLALFTHNDAARSAVRHARKIKELTAKASVG